MTETRKNDLRDVSNIEAKYLVFKMKGHENSHLYVVANADAPADTATGCSLWPKNEVEFCAYHEENVLAQNWWAVCNVDCFEPPRAIIRSWWKSDAVWAFEDEFASEVKIDEIDLKDYNEDSLHYNSTGTPVETGSLNCVEMVLVQIII